MNSTTSFLSRQFRRLVAAGLTLLLLVTAAPQMQGCDACTLKSLTFQGLACVNGAFDLSLNDGVSAGGGASSSFGIYSKSTPATTQLLLNHEYTMTFHGNFQSLHVAFSGLEPCFVVKVKGGDYTDWTPTTTLDYGAMPTGGQVQVMVTYSVERGAAEVDLTHQSVHWRASLGKSGAWQAAGSLVLDQATVSALSYDPSQLRLVGAAGSVEVITNGATLRQLRAPDTLVDIVVINDSQYEIRYYRLGDVLEKVDGLYPIAGTAQPVVIWRIENPVAGNPNSGQVLLSEIRDGVVVGSSNFNIAGNTSTHTRGGGKAIESRVTTYDPTSGDRSVVVTLKDDANVVARSTKESYHNYSWGEELIGQIEDFGGTARTSSYAYFDDVTQPASHRRISQIQRPDGSWARYEYSVTDNILQTKTYEPWGAAAPATPQAATVANSKVTTATTGPANVGSGTTEYYESFVTILGVAAGHTLHYRNTVGVLHDDDYFSATGFTSHSTSMNNVGGHAEYNRPAARAQADGWADTFDYVTGSYDAATHTFTQGDGKALQTTVLHGTVDSPSGVALRTTSEVAVDDERGNRVVEQAGICTLPGLFDTISVTFHDYDDDGNLLQSTLNGRVTLLQTWSGKEVQTRMDEYGTVTSYVYDELGRVKTETRAGVAPQPAIVTTYQYDAADRVLSTTRAAGGVSLTTTAEYAGGRPSARTDENGLRTQIDYSLDGLVVTTTRPDGGTEIVTHNRDGQVKSVTGTGVVPRNYVYAVDGTTGNTTTTEYVGPGGTSSVRWVKTEYDWAGRMVKQTKPGSIVASPGVSVAENTYNEKGQQVGQARTGFALLKTEYDSLGAAFRSGLDIDGNGVLDPASNDRITEFTSGYLQSGGEWYSYERTLVYAASGNAVGNLATEERTQLTGLPVTRVSRSISINPLGVQTVSTVDVDLANKLVTTTINIPGSTLPSVSLLQNGLLQSATDGSAALPSTFTYDGLGRMLTKTDPRGAVTTTTYVAGKNQIAGVQDHLGHLTAFTYHGQGVAGAGEKSTITNSDNTVRRMTYTQWGAPDKTWGSAGAPFDYGYDAYGDQVAIRTYRTEAGWDSVTWPGGTADTTTLTRQPSTGLITSRTDAAAHAVTFVYSDTADYRVTKRTWARSVSGNNVTTYGYDASTGELISTTYSNTSTPAVTMTYDRQGRLATVTDGAGTRTLGYDALGLATEEFTAGLMAGASVERVRDNFGRMNSIQARNQGFNYPEARYTYNAVDGRLEEVTVHDAVAHYGYEQSPLSNNVGQISFRRAGTERFVTNRQYDALGRSGSVSHAAGGITLSSQVSGPVDYDAMNRRQKRTDEKGDYWQYSYNLRGEIQSGDKHTSAGTLLAGWQFGFTYDAAGNRQSSSRGGDSTGANKRTAAYTPNAVNGYASRTIPGYFDVVGSSTPDAAVTVNGAATERQGASWRKETAVTNTSVPVATAVTVAGSRGADTASQTGKVFTPKTPEVFTYDLDGNLTGDGRWIYTWDGENRLLSVQTAAAAATAGAAGVKRVFAYDYMGRRVAKTTYVATAPAPYTYTTIASVSRNLYNGWNLIMEMDDSGASLRSYVWGLDLSGTLDQGRGVGGLLFFENYVAGSSTLHAAATDEMGNVLALSDTASGALSASYQYGPFGEDLGSAGAMARENPFRFSTKYVDNETGLIYYGMRYYQPATGRWISRDPSGEAGGMNLYAMVGNNPLNSYDPLGLWSVGEHTSIITDWMRHRSNRKGGGVNYRNYLWHKCIPVDVTGQLIDGNDEVDGTGNHKGNFFAAQSLENSYQHAMRSPSQDVPTARAQMYRFVNQELSDALNFAGHARQLYYEPVSKETLVYLMGKAVHYVGRAQHPIADTTSPQHRGFQIWYGLTAMLPEVLPGPSLPPNPYNFMAPAGPQVVLYSPAWRHHAAETTQEYLHERPQPVATVEGFFDWYLDYVLKE
jgi:RHS repeat-associated protein